MSIRLGLNDSSVSFTARKRVAVGTFSTENARTLITNVRPSNRASDFVGTGILRLTKLAASTCNNQHRGEQFYAVLVAHKYAVRVPSYAVVHVDGRSMTMEQFWNSIIAL